MFCEGAGVRSRPVRRWSSVRQSSRGGDAGERAEEVARPRVARGGARGEEDRGHAMVSPALAGWPPPLGQRGWPGAARPTGGSTTDSAVGDLRRPA